VKEHFWPFLEDFHWTLTLAWPIADTDQKPATWLKGENYTSLWQQMEAYNASGMLDVQSHGYIHNIPIDDYSTDEFIHHEIVDSRKPLQDHFYCKDYQTGQPIANCQTDQPLAYIWPGGGFSARAAQIAQLAGYKIGFTTNPRGPVMYNWVPLASQPDPGQPEMLVEAGVNNPLMVLPRYWSSDAAYRIDDVYHVSQEAVKAAQQTKATELDYYNIVCLNKTGPIPTQQP
jgi:hypothetical protein